MIIKAIFIRKTSKDDFLQNGWFAINHNWVLKEKRRRFHGKWFKLISKYGKSYRILRFDPRIGKVQESKGEIDVDWQAWIKLNGFANDILGSLELEIKKVRFWEYSFVGLTHPDPAIRLSSYLALISIILGILGVAF